MVTGVDWDLAVIRKAFVMRLNSDQVSQYKYRHDNIWPELAALLRSHGVHNYSIFLHPQTCQLFAYAEIENEQRWQAIAHSPICQKWWQFMADIMATNPDASPQTIELAEMFHLD